MKKKLTQWFGESSDSNLIINKQQVTLLLGSFLLSTVAAFGIGFYWGKQKALDELMSHVEQESFSDKVFSSLCALYETGEDEQERSDMVEDTQDQKKNEQLNEQLVAAEPEIRYFAQLAGFGSEEKARAYVQKLSKEGVEVELKSHRAKSSRAHTKTWYQVETKAMKKNDLESLVARLASRDHLRDVVIQEYSTFERQSA